MYIKDPNPWDNDPVQDALPLLYNIEHDPSEKYNVARDNSDIVDQIFSISDKHVKEVPRKPTQYDDILPNYQSAYDAYNKNR